MLSEALNEKQYKILGRLLVKKHPDVAQSLLATLNHTASEDDITKIDLYFIRFCTLQGIAKESYYGAVYKTSKVDVFRLFIASMVHLYFPEVYFQPIEELNLKKNGFVTAIAVATGQHTANVSSRIREVVLWEKEYDDFREKVVTMVEKLKNVA
jgi:hypothetical protein